MTKDIPVAPRDSVTFKLVHSKKKNYKNIRDCLTLHHFKSKHKLGFAYKNEMERKTCMEYDMK